MLFTSDVAKGRCPVCRAPSCGCGPSTSDIVPVDQLEESSMASKLKTYEVTINGNKTTMQLNEDDAKRYGATEVATKKAPAPQNKKRTTKDED